MQAKFEALESKVQKKEQDEKKMQQPVIALENKLQEKVQDEEKILDKIQDEENAGEQAAGESPRRREDAEDPRRFATPCWT